MKKLTISFLLVLSSVNYVHSQSGWYPVCSNFPYFTRDFDFVDELTGFMACNGNKILKTTNGGINWFELYAGNISYSGFITFINQDTGYVGCPGGKILITTNQGSSFSTIYTDSSGYITKIHFLNNLTGYAINWSGRGKLLKTTDSGWTWSILYTYVQSISSLLYDFYCFDATTILLSVGWNGFHDGQSLIKKSTDGGQNFVDIFSSNTTYFARISFINNTTGFLTESSFYRTTESGLTWIPNQNLNSITGNIVKTNNNNVFSNSRTGSGSIPIIYHSTDSGINWDTAYINNSSEGGFERIKFINDSVGWALLQYYSSNCVLLKTTTGGLTFVNQINSGMPKSFSLSQNYPNPFNPVTKIKFQIPPFTKGGSGGFIKLIIYDILGKEITTLVNEQLKPGSYEAEWDGSDFASGIYFYSLVTDDFTETKRMVLIK